MSKSCPVLSPIPNFPVLVPQAIDHRASQDPDRIIFTYPNPSTKQLVDVSWKEFAHQVNIGAWSIDKLIGSRRSSSDPVKVIGVLARSDAAYMVTIYALHKCGITPLLLSIRNSRAATSNLLKLTGSVAILADSYHRGEAEASSIEVGSIPVFDMAPLPGRVTEERESFPFLLRWDDECDKPAVILHTSGSTGLPKPVAWSTRFIWHQTYYPAPYVAKYIGSSMLCTLPIFHGSGLSLIRASMLWLGWKIILPDSSKPVTASSIIDICINPSTAPDIVAGAPSVIQDITSIPGGWEIMRHTKTWFFVGAPVPPHFGDELVERGVHITPNLGSTETGQMSVLEPEMRSPADWNYHEMRPDLDIILQSRGRSVESGPFELIILEKVRYHEYLLTSIHLNSSIAGWLEAWCRQYQRQRYRWICDIGLIHEASLPLHSTTARRPRRRRRRTGQWGEDPFADHRDHYRGQFVRSKCDRFWRWTRTERCTDCSS